MKKLWVQPTPEQEAQAVLVQHDIVEVFNRLGREGVDPRIILSGAGAATAFLLAGVFGSASIEPWFAKQVELVRDLKSPPVH